MKGFAQGSIGVMECCIARCIWLAFFSLFASSCHGRDYISVSSKKDVVEVSIYNAGDRPLSVVTGQALFYDYGDKEGVVTARATDDDGRELTQCGRLGMGDDRGNTLSIAPNEEKKFDIRVEDMKTIFCRNSLRLSVRYVIRQSGEIREIHSHVADVR